MKVVVIQEFAISTSIEHTKDNVPQSGTYEIYIRLYPYIYGC